MVRRCDSDEERWASGAARIYSSAKKLNEFVFILAISVNEWRMKWCFVCSIYMSVKGRTKEEERDRLFRPIEMVIAFFFSLFISCVRLWSAVCFPSLYIEMHRIHYWKSCTCYFFRLLKCDIDYPRRVDS